MLWGKLTDLVSNDDVEGEEHVWSNYPALGFLIKISCLIENIFEVTHFTYINEFYWPDWKKCVFIGINMKYKMSLVATKSK